MYRVLARMVLICVVALLPLQLRAAVISYTTSQVAGSTWRYDYSVTNDAPSAALEEFSVFFDRDLYADLLVAAAPVGWDALVVQPDLLLPDDGFFDALAIADGLAPSATRDGFAVQFTWKGLGTPAGQPFAVINPLTFATLESGTTTAVPLPATGWIVALAVGLLAGRGMRRREMRPSMS